MTRIEKVAEFARETHKNQVKKYTGEPYFNHLQDVADLVKHLENEYPFIVEVAYLHDILEDQITKVELYKGLHRCEYSREEIEQIINYVEELTDEYTIENYPTYNRSLRKSMEAERLSKISPLTQTVKYADLFNNTSSIVELAPDFAKIYLREKEMYLKGMILGDKKLRNKAINVIKKYK